MLIKDYLFLILFIFIKDLFNFLAMDYKEFELIYKREDKHWWYVGMLSIMRTLIEFFYNKSSNLRILDAGCGNGILGIGAALLGAKKVIFLDVDPGMILVAKKNAKKMSLSGEFVIADISEYNPETPPDTVLMNPPFGRKSGIRRENYCAEE